MNHPTTYTIGDAISWMESPGGFESGVDTLKIVLLKINGGDSDRVEIIPEVISGAFVFTMPTSGVSDGDWQSILLGTKDGKRTTVDRGEICIYPDPLTAAPTISSAQKILNAITAHLEGRASEGEMNISIGDRTIGLIPIPDLLALKKHFASEVALEEIKRKRITGQVVGRVGVVNYQLR